MDNPYMTVLGGYELVCGHVGLGGFGGIRMTATQWALGLWEYERGLVGHVGCPFQLVVAGTQRLSSSGTTRLGRPSRLAW